MVRSGTRGVMALVLLAVVGCGQQAGGPAQSGNPAEAPTPVATVIAAPTVANPAQTAVPTLMPTGETESSPAPGATEAPTGTASAVTTPTAEGGGAASGEEADVDTPEEVRAVEAARRALAKQTGVPEDEPRLVSLAETEWPDASLGCPRPGMMYAQVITPGYLVTFEADGRTYEVHTDRNGRVVICKDGASAGRTGGDDAVVRLTRSGGLAGEVLTIVVAVDGAVRLESEAGGSAAHTGTLPPAQVTRLRALVESPEWRALEDQYGEPMPDASAYTVEAKGKRVTTHDGAQSPPLMRRLLAQLASYWASE